VAKSQVAVWFTNGTTRLAATFFALGGGWDLAGAGDFNGDGRTDLFFRTVDASAVSWLMSKAGIASVVGYPRVTGEWAYMGSGDFLGSGKDQILWRYTPTGDFYLWGNVDATAQLHPLGYPGSGWQLQVVGDFDGDGRADLLWRHSSGQTAIWLNASSMSVAFPPGVGSDWQVIGAMQAYGDGRSNVLWRRTDGVLAHWRFNAALVPSATFLQAVPSAWVPVAQ
jgi:hypothetical protein